MQFAMPRVVSSIAGSPASPVAAAGVDEGERVRIRESVMAGPAFAGGLGDASRVPILAMIVGAGALERALAEAGHAEVRRQVLTGEVTGESLVLVTSRSALPGLEENERISLDVLPDDEAAAMLAELIGAGLSTTDAARTRSATPSTMNVVVACARRSASPSQTMLSPFVTSPATPATPVMRPK